LKAIKKWRVIYEDPRTSTPGLGLLLWMQKVYGDKAPEAWQKLAAKTVTVERLERSLWSVPERRK
jgi:thiamine transport system substrate-binding protein